MTSIVAAGAALTAIGLAGRYILRQGAIQAVKYYKGGFEPAMNRREASLVLGISPHSSPEKIKQAYKRIIILNHPDRGGSPYLAAKISEAKEILEKSN